MVSAAPNVTHVLNAAHSDAQPLAPWGYQYLDRRWHAQDGSTVDRTQLAQRLAIAEMVLLAWEFRANT